MTLSKRKHITSEMFVSYSYCQRKVYNLLNCKDQNISHEYCEIINKFAAKNIKNYYDILVSSGFNILEKSVFYCNNRRYNESDVFSQIDIRYNNLVAYIDLLKIIKPNSSKLCLQYEPYISIGNNEINPEAKQRMEFIAYILSQKFSCIVPYGIIIRKGGKTSRIKLSKQPKDIEGIIVKINSFNGEAILKPPSIFLNKHCAICPFKKECIGKAEKENSLTLLDRMTPKIIRKYEKKGIFTVNQLSYLFKPRRRKKSKYGTPIKFSF